VPSGVPAPELEAAFQGGGTSVLRIEEKFKQLLSIINKVMQKKIDYLCSVKV
jgi:hypothetical protein